MNDMRKLFVSAFFAFATFCLSAKVELPSVIGDNMVLQQQTSAALWGKASPGKTVTISPSWTREKYKVKADPQTGKWMVRVGTPEAGGPYSITFSDGEALSVSNVLIGEVWYCSGQSNMYMRMCGYPSSPTGGAADAVYSAKASIPVRIYEPPCRMTVDPQYECEGRWEENTPDVVVRSSALAWFFATYLQGVLDVPVGVIVSSYGGSSIESWLDRPTVESRFPGEFDLSVLDAPNPMMDVNTPCALYNGQVAALEPYTFKGMLWYQGCTNRARAEQYTRLQTVYAEMMREKFQNPDAGFYFVQLSPFWCGDPEGFQTGYFLEAQQKTLKTIPHSGMVTTTDLGIFDNIHPIDKRTPAVRLAYLALQNDYGIKPFDATAPTYDHMVINETPVARDNAAISGKSITVFFKTCNTGMADSVGPRGEDLEGFEIAGADRVFHKAHAMAGWGKDVIVWSDEVPEPVAVRYSFRNWAPGNLTNTFGIPAAPFRTDDWDDLER